jgi:hypothetical protein
MHRTLNFRQIFEMASIPLLLAVHLEVARLGAHPYDSEEIINRNPECVNTVIKIEWSTVTPSIRGRDITQLQFTRFVQRDRRSQKFSAKKWVCLCCSFMTHTEFDLPELVSVWCVSSLTPRG